MSCLWILLFFVCYVHIFILGEQGKTIEDAWLSHLSWASCHAAARVPKRFSADSAQGSADLWQRSRRWQRAMPQPKAAPSTASNSWKLILWLSWISQQLLSVHNKMLISIWEQRLVSALPVSLILEKSKIRVYNRSHYKGLINLSGLQIVSR